MADFFGRQSLLHHRIICNRMLEVLLRVVENLRAVLTLHVDGDAIACAGSLDADLVVVLRRGGELAVGLRFAFEPGGDARRLDELQRHDQSAEWLRGPGHLERRRSANRRQRQLHSEPGDLVIYSLPDHDREYPRR